MRRISHWEHRYVWRNLFWLPEPIYYWLLDRFADNAGWRPLFYRTKRGSE